VFSLSIYVQGLAVAILAAACTWAVSVYRKNVAIVDSVWSLMFVLMACVYAAAGPLPMSKRAWLALALVAVWALRLSLYISWRNWGHGEDPRYQAIRARNQPNFAFKSLYLVFVLQALLAWLISLPLMEPL
jgi:steroid 5-alpha reductase family enzyme